MLILRTSKRDTSVEMPVYSHQMVFPCNKDPVQILPIQLKSHLKFHIDRQILMLNNRQEKHPLTPSSTFS